MNFTPGFSKPLASTWWSMPTTFGNTLTTGMTSAIFSNTPIFFPVAWDRSKIHGPSVRVSLPNFHGVTAFFTASSVAARFFAPQVGGLGTDFTGVGAFRIDHDQRFQATTHVQYQPFKDLPWIAVNWRYDNGLVAGGVPCFNITNPNTVCAGTSFLSGGIPTVDLSGITADQQAQTGLTCNGSGACTLTAAFASCPASQYGSTLIKIPAPGTSDDDHNPPRIQPRNLFDISRWVTITSSVVTDTNGARGSP